jgi:hypothetical protein
MNQRFQSLQQLGEQLERVASGEHLPVGRLNRSRWAITSLLSGTGRGLRSAVAAGVFALIAGGGAAVVLLSSGAPVAYAGWTAAPAAASSTAVATAVRKCYRTGRSPGIPFDHPVLSEARGRSTAAVFLVAGSAYMCLYNAALPDVEERSLGPLHAAPGPDRLSLPYGVYAGGGFGKLPAKLLKALKQRPLKRSTMLALSRFHRGAGTGSWAVGRVGSGVKAVTFAFAGRRPVLASVQNGWYFAWWPWLAEPSSVTITASGETETSPMAASPHDGFGNRPYPACTPGTNGCVFVKTPVAPQPATGPGPVAQATRICNQDTLDGHQLPADVFSSSPVLTDHHGVFTALITTTRQKVWVCLQGGYPNNLHRFDVDDIGAYGKVRPAPDPDRISLPYSSDGGVGSGRQFPPQSPKGETPAQRRKQMLAWMPARAARLRGGGYGPYALGRVGRNVSSVALRFADGTTEAAALQNSWYFLWWPANGRPTTITVTTARGTSSTPVKTSDDARVSLTPTCQPGSQGCVFARSN